MQKKADLYIEFGNVIKLFIGIIKFLMFKNLRIAYNLLHDTLF